MTTLVICSLMVLTVISPACLMLLKTCVIIFSSSVSAQRAEGMGETSFAAFGLILLCLLRTI